MNSRLDELQAAILGVKLAHLDEHNDERRRLAARYGQRLRGVRLPADEMRDQAVHHVYHLYVVQHPRRDDLRENLRRRGVGSMIHYPTPVHRQPAYAHLGYGAGSLPVTERLAAEVLSLPLYVGLKPEDLDAVAHAVTDSVKEVRLPHDKIAVAFGGAEVLITGGLGFIGSNLAVRLVALGARVTLADAMIPAYGGNPFNIESVKDRVTTEFVNICDRRAIDRLVRGKDYVFHLAAQPFHVLALTDPFPDVDFNVTGTVVLMEALRRRNPRARVVHAGTRGQYGPAARLPVSEDAPTNPLGIYEATKLAAEKIIQVYNDTHGIHAVLLRLTNIYGPRAQMRHAHYGIANWFVRLAIDDDCIRVFGDGRIRRDFLYVDDCVEAMLLCAADDRARGQVLNVGNDRPSNFRELAETLIAVAGSGRWELAPFTPERKAQEPGDFYPDIRKIGRLVGWRPRTTLEEGLRRTVDYYRAHRGHYWAPPAGVAGQAFRLWFAADVPAVATTEVKVRKGTDHDW